MRIGKLSLTRHGFVPVVVVGVGARSLTLIVHLDRGVIGGSATFRRYPVVPADTRRAVIIARHTSVGTIREQVSP